MWKPVWGQGKQCSCPLIDVKAGTVPGLHTHGRHRELLLPTLILSSPCFPSSPVSQHILGQMVKFPPQKVGGGRRSNTSSEIPYGSACKQRKRPCQGSTQGCKDQNPVNVWAKLQSRASPRDSPGMDTVQSRALKVLLRSHMSFPKAQWAAGTLPSPHHSSQRLRKHCLRCG